MDDAKGCIWNVCACAKCESTWWESPTGATEITMVGEAMSASLASSCPVCGGAITRKAFGADEAEKLLGLLVTHASGLIHLLSAGTGASATPSVMDFFRATGRDKVV